MGTLPLVAQNIGLALVGVGLGYLRSQPDPPMVPDLLALAFLGPILWQLERTAASSWSPARVYVLKPLLSGAILLFSGQGMTRPLLTRTGVFLYMLLNYLLTPPFHGRGAARGEARKGGAAVSLDEDVEAQLNARITGIKGDVASALEQLSCDVDVLKEAFQLVFQQLQALNRSPEDRLVSTLSTLSTLDRSAGAGSGSSSNRGQNSPLFDAFCGDRSACGLRPERLASPADAGPPTLNTLNRISSLWPTSFLYNTAGSPPPDVIWARPNQHTLERARSAARGPGPARAGAGSSGSGSGSSLGLKHRSRVIKP